MALKKLLTQNKNSILQRWFNLIADTYPSEVSGFLRESDRFTNPVGYTISQEINSLYEEVLQGRVDSDKASASLDSILRIRAIQDFSPQEAISFVFLLKKAMTDELGSEIEKKQSFGEWLNFEPRIDKLAAVAFDKYMQCREKIYELQVNEVKADREIAFRLLKLMGGKNGEHGEVME
ncbi:MAG: hypothetical protein A2Y59_02105 [Chloroflexi bacterium RBG_13_52_14]|nr:MAG: hypothetical protein A2Y59_02105 [Chloroflexi bacterium RBG_13_52_14]